ncbi:MAG: hypothetical protein SAJ37_13720 [Oscillatoria sp. PMC 1068.18]|nr:hypothetical protein [Oscillatoria sp. PMC 1076.18]MEC4989784.1 hypothetical protein [Oscillatoria sp. PMC 1068.18]
MPLKVVENFDASFTLTPEAKETLFDFLKNEKFLQQICQQVKVEKVKFTELLFQPVPYSVTTPKGMPAELESYYNNEDYAIVNVPPNIMFKAKIFKPSRLCAIYQKLA